MANLTMRQLRKKIREYDLAIAKQKTIAQQQIDVLKQKITLPKIIVTGVTIVLGGVLINFLRRKFKPKIKIPAVKPPEIPIVVKPTKTSRLVMLMQMVAAATSFVSTLIAAKDLVTKLIGPLYKRDVKTEN